MKITLFTSNKNRHNYFINLLSKNCKELFVVQESSTIFQGLIPGHYQVSNTMKDYFDKVNNAQKKIFGNSYIKNSNKNISLLPLSMGDLNQCEHKLLNQFLESDLYIIFGSSYIKGELVNFLIKKKAINIHMGISPYYRGTDCNFWALYDENPHLVGSTIHFLSKGLDNGPILYHAMSNMKINPFINAPGSANGTLSPSEKLFAPQTICLGVFWPSSIWHTSSLSASGCFLISFTWQTINLLGNLIMSSTSIPENVNKSLISLSVYSDRSKCSPSQSIDIFIRIVSRILSHFRLRA